MKRLIALSIAIMTILTYLSSLVSVPVAGTSVNPAWSTPTNLSENAGESQYQKIVADELGNVHLVWRDNTLYPFSTLLYHRVRYTNGDWSDLEIIPNSVVEESVPDIAVSSNGVLHVVWRAPTPLGYIYYSQRTLLGNWTEPLSLGVGNSITNIDIDVGPDETVHVMWNNGVYRERSSDGVWSEASMAFGAEINNNGSLRIAVDSTGTVHAVIGDSNSGDIYYVNRRSGQAWNSVLNVSDNLTRSESPQMGINEQGDVHIVWRDYGGPGNWDIFHRSISNGTWTDIENVSNMPGESYLAELAVSPDGSIHVVWSEIGSSSGTYYVGKSPGGNWTHPIGRAGTRSFLSIGMNEDIHWVWQAGGWTHSWRRAETSWSAPVKVGDGEGYYSMVVDTRNILHATWSGYAGGTTDTFYSNFAPENAPATSTSIPSTTPSITATPTAILNDLDRLYLPNVQNSN